MNEIPDDLAIVLGAKCECEERR